MRLFRGPFALLRLYLAPHLPCEENLRGITAGRTRSGVAPEGRRLARFLDLDAGTRSRLAAIVHSGLPRAAETVELALARHGIPVLQDERLCAIDYGEYQGRSMEDIHRLRHEHAQRPFPGGESFGDMARRHLDLLEELDSRYPDGAVLLVAHNETFPVLLHLCAGLSLEESLEVAHRRAQELRRGSVEEFYARAPYGPLVFRRGSRPRPGGAQAGVAAEGPPLIVVAQHKSGTNLIARLLEEIGYPPIGLGIRPTYEEVGSALERRYGSRLAFEDPEKLFTVLTGDFPGRRSLFFHHLPRSPSLEAWLAQPGHRLLYHFRDPRAVVISLVHYLDGFGGDAAIPGDWWALAHVAQIARLSTMEDRIDYVLRCMPSYLDTYRRHSWMLEDPRVCTTTFEELAGPRGGGSEKLQGDAVARVLRFLDVPRAATPRLDRLFSTDARTFRAGRVDGWRAEFPAAALLGFQARYADVLRAHGYETRSDRELPD